MQIAGQELFPRFVSLKNTRDLISPMRNVTALWLAKYILSCSQLCRRVMFCRTPAHSCLRPKVPVHQSHGPRTPMLHFFVRIRSLSFAWIHLLLAGSLGFLLVAAQTRVV